jgi:hypothetical protein
MAAPAASPAEPARRGGERDGDRLGQRDLLVLILELTRRRRPLAGTAPQRVTRSTR